MSTRKKKTSVEFSIENEIVRTEPTQSNSECNLISASSRASLPMIVGWWRNYRRDSTVNVNCDEDGNYRCIKQNHSPPPDEMEISTSAESCSSPVCHLRISRNTLKQIIFECMRSTNSASVQYLEDIEKGRMTLEDVEKYFSTSTDMERNIAFLCAALFEKLDILQKLYECKVDIHFCEPSESYTALHLSAFNDNVECAMFLIECGADVNYCSEKYTPIEAACFHNSSKVAKLLLEHGADVSTNRVFKKREQSYRGTPLHSAVRANAIECVQLILAERKAQGRNEAKEEYSSLHVAAEMGHLQCLKILLDQGIDPNLMVPETKNTALHLAAEGGFNECVSLLLSRGAKVNAKNDKGQTALHLAARVQSLECVENLLEVGHADPNILDDEERIALHSAVSKTLNSCDITELLIAKGSNVNQADKYGYTPLHVAAINENTHCVQILINNGANVIGKTKGGNTGLGIIIRKTPLALPVLYKKLDSAIMVHDPEVSSSKEVLMKLDFRIFSQHCQIGEMDFLKTFLDEGQKEILEHPLCQAFLHIKWEKIRKYFISRLAFYGMLVLCLTVYTFAAFVVCGDTPVFVCANKTENCTSVGSLTKNCTCENVTKTACGEMIVYLSENSTECDEINKFYQCDEENRMLRDGFWCILIILTVMEALRKSYALTGCSTLKYYMLHIDNIVEWFVLLSSFAISRMYIGPNYWQNHVAAFTVLFAWINLLLLVGQTPVLGSYVAMYMKVQKQFAMIFVAYACLLIGFTFSFCIIFQTKENFRNPGVGFIQIIAFMIGALDYNALMESTGQPYGISAHLVFFVFMLFVTIIMWNLLVGIAVRDIQGLQKTALISRLVRQTKLISSIELSLFNDWLPNYILIFLRYTALVSPSGYRVVLQVKPLNHQEKRLPKDILHRAYEIAKLGRRSARTPSVTSRILSFIGSKQNSQTQLLPELADVTKLQQEVEANNIAVSRLTEEIQELKELIRHSQKH